MATELSVGSKLRNQLDDIALHREELIERLRILEVEATGDECYMEIADKLPQNMSMDMPAYAAVYGEDTLVFGRANNVPQTYMNKSLSESYTNIETTNYNISSRPGWKTRNESITSVHFLFTIKPISTYEWFYGMSNLTNITGIEFLDTSNTVSMSYMFTLCSTLTSLDVSNFDTSKATSMTGMFDNCSSITLLDVSNFDTSKVTGMNSMFNECSSLTTLDVSGFDTSWVTNMGYMFKGCKVLSSLNVKNFNTARVTDMKYMFYGCSGLLSLDVSNFVIKQRPSLAYMFTGCTKLENISLGDFSVYNNASAKAVNVLCLFQNCASLKEIDLGTFDMSGTKTTTCMFDGCTSLEKILCVNNWSTKLSNITSSSYMFRNCKNLKGNKGTVYDSSKVDKTYARFDGGATSPGYITCSLV